MITNDFKAARAKAEQLDAKLLATDKRLGGNVRLSHHDGSFLFFTCAFALFYKRDFVIILTEHHGTHVYHLGDLKYVRAMGPEISIETLPTKPQVDHDKIAKMLGATRRGKVSAKGGYFGALQTAAEVRDIQKAGSDKGR